MQKSLISRYIADLNDFEKTGYIKIMLRLGLRDFLQSPKLIQKIEETKAKLEYQYRYSEKLEKLVAYLLVETDGKIEIINHVKIITCVLKHYNHDACLTIAKDMTVHSDVVILAGAQKSQGKLIVAVRKNYVLSAKDILKAIMPSFAGKGGGSYTLAQAVGDPLRLNNAIVAAKDIFLASSSVD